MDRIVTKLPLEELWNAQAILPSHKLRALGHDAITSLLRSGAVHFVIADCGQPLRWIPNGELFDFWKKQVAVRLVEPDDAVTGFHREGFPKGFCYVASEWSGDIPVIVLEMHH